MMDSSDLYFYLFIIAANVAVALLGVLWTKIKGTPYGAGIEAMAKTLVYAAAQQLPGESGAAKLDWVLAQAAQLGGLNKKQLAYFRLLVEEKVKELKLAEQAAQPVLIDATAQPNVDEIAAAVQRNMAGVLNELAPAVASSAIDLDEDEPDPPAQPLKPWIGGGRFA